MTNDGFERSAFIISKLYHWHGQFSFLKMHVLFNALCRPSPIMASSRISATVILRQNGLFALNTEFLATNDPFLLMNHIDSAS